jgi:hypothetical protein
MLNSSAAAQTALPKNGRAKAFMISLLVCFVFVTAATRMRGRIS